MTELANHNPALTRLQVKALAAALIGAAAVAVGAAMNPAHYLEQFLDSYLFAYLFILGITLGSLALVMLHHMTGGDWGYCIRRISESAAMTMPVVTILFIPIWLGVKNHHLFPFADPEVVKGNKILEFQVQVWLNFSFWSIRAAIYFGIWNLWAFLMWYGAGKHDRSGDPWLVVRMQRLSALGLLLYVVTMTFAAIDWIMTREAGWYSTIIGLVIVVSQALSAIVFAIAMLRVLRHSQPLGNYITPPRLNDLGNLFLSFTILWAYMSFAQLLIIWMGNMATDSPWYIRRGFSGDATAPHGWKFIAAMLLIFHFFVPFFVLLGKANKRKIEIITALAMMVLVMRVIDCFWWVGPSSLADKGIEPLKFLTPRTPHWLDLVTPLALFGTWLTFMLLLLKTRPLLARTEQGPHLEHGATHDAHAAA